MEDTERLVYRREIEMLKVVLYLVCRYTLTQKDKQVTTLKTQDSRTSLTHCGGFSGR
jgi:hypothetical protein